MDFRYLAHYPDTHTAHEIWEEARYVGRPVREIGNGWLDITQQVTVADLYSNTHIVTVALTPTTTVKAVRYEL